MEYLIVLAIYTILILAFVPLKKIGSAQDWVKAKIVQAKNKINN